MSLKPESKGYFADTISAFSPWSSRPSTPKPPTEEPPRTQTGQDTSAAVARGVAQRGADHKLNPRKKISLKDYPPDCPPLNVQWYHAVDVAKRKPQYALPVSKDEKPTGPPKKWKAFDVGDSRAIEAVFQDLPEKDVETDCNENNSRTAGSVVGGSSDIVGKKTSSDTEPNKNTNTSLQALHDGDDSAEATVPVNEDFLFDVNIDNRELAPAYWLGPIYEVRRGSWFYVDGTTLRPCDENLALQLEEGYLKTTPWRRVLAQTSTTLDDARESRSGQTIPAVAHGAAPGSEDASVTSHQNGDGKALPPTVPKGLIPHRLFGAYMSTMVQYLDGETAYLLTDDFLSRMTGSVYERFAGGAHLSGTKVVRGFSDLTRKRSAKDAKRSTTPAPTGSSQNRAASTSRFASSREKSEQVVVNADANGQGPEAQDEPETESTVQRLERRMTSLLASAMPDDPAKQDEEARKLEEREISDDYRDTSGENQDREIEHLILITHGIGQRLGQRFETFNFIHDVNELRKTLKSVYKSSPDLQALNAEIDKFPKNCRIQVLPVCWRHMLDFPHQSLKYNRKEYDLADLGDSNDEMYPSLQDITVEGVPAVRAIIADLFLDILLYQNPAYRGHISRIVAEECNRMYKLFKERNPSFQGKVSLCGHSLGSAIFFDIGVEQPQDLPFLDRLQKRKPSQKTQNQLDFEIESIFLLGSPVGLFQMLQGKNIEGRENPNEVTLDGSDDDLDSTVSKDEYSGSSGRREVLPRNTLVSSPKCRQLFNIFNPADPIAYRLEPLISPSMSRLKPQQMPWVKKSWNAPVGQGLTAIPAILGQSVSGFWSNISAGLADRFIHRSLGISAEDAAKLAAPARTLETQGALSAGAGTNIVAGGVLSQLSRGPKRSTVGYASDDGTTSPQVGEEDKGRRPPTLLDAELETLYEGFQKRRESAESPAAASRNAADAARLHEVEEQARHLRREDAKVRVLNSNGRVDYNLQEGAFEFSFLGGLASHLAYWTDEDVSHFITSQLLSRQRVVSARHLKSRSMG